MGSDAVEVFAYTDNLMHPYTEAEDLGLALVKFSNGAYAMVEGTVNIYPKNLSDTLALFGESGTVALTGKTLDDVQAWNFAKGPQSRDEAVNQLAMTEMSTGHTPLYADVLTAIANKTQPLCTANEGRKALELVLAIYKSAAEGCPVKLPLSACATTDFEGRF
jgi:predicted dehydrogenase